MIRIVELADSFVFISLRGLEVRSGSDQLQTPCECRRLCGSIFCSWRVDCVDSQAPNVIIIVAELQRKLDPQLTQVASAKGRSEAWDGDVWVQALRTLNSQIS